MWWKRSGTSRIWRCAVSAMHKVPESGAPDAVPAARAAGVLKRPARPRNARRGGRPCAASLTAGTASGREMSGGADVEALLHEAVGGIGALPLGCGVGLALAFG